MALIYYGITSTCTFHNQGGSNAMWHGHMTHFRCIYYLWVPIFIYCSLLHTPTILNFSKSSAHPTSSLLDTSNIHHHIVVHSYAGCWEVAENWPFCIKLLLLSRYFRRTIDSMGGLFTEVRIASCKTVHLDANETQNVWFG